MTTSVLERADAEFATLRRRREHLSEQAVRLHAELRDLQARGGSQDEQGDVAKKLREATEGKQSMYGAYTVAKRRAQQTAARQIRESASYGKQVLAVACAWAPFLASWAALVATTADARREGVPLAPIPPSVAAQPAEAASWLKGHIAAGVLDADALPAELRRLIGGGDG